MGSSPLEKIICITNDFGPRAGGIETFVIGLLERTPRNSVIVYTSYQRDSQEYDRKWLEDYGIEVIRDKSKILLPTPRVARAIQSLVRERGLTVALFGAAAPLGLLSHGIRAAGIKRIVALTHGHEVWWAKIWPFSWALKRIGSGVDTLTYLGEFTRRASARSLSQESAQSMVRIAPGIDTSHFAPQANLDSLRSELDLDGKRVIISVGRLVHRKGQDKLIEAMPQILKSFPDAVLLLVGEGPIKSMLDKLIRHHGLEHNVIFTGRVQFADLPKYIQLGEVFAMPSRDRFFGLEVEGLGIVYLEASACGVPVIVGKSGGAPDAVLENKTGLIVDGTKPAEIADAVCKLLGDKELAKQMGRSGRDWVVENWQWKIWSDKFNKLINR